MPLGCTGRTLQYDHEPSLYFGDCCPVRLAYWRPCVDRNYLVDAASCGHAPGAPTPVGGIKAAGERRYLTVIFCDLVGSTGMAAKLDAGEWRDLVGAYLDARPAARDTGLGRRRGGNWRRSDRHRRAIRGRIAFDDSNVLAFCDKLISGATRTLMREGCRWTCLCPRRGGHFPVTRRDFLRS